MIRRFLTLSLPIFLVLTLMFPTNSMAITAEDRLIEVERQLQAIAEQISNYEGQLTDCLLYTSPSPRDWMVSRMPSSA